MIWKTRTSEKVPLKYSANWWMLIGIDCSGDLTLARLPPPPLPLRSLISHHSCTVMTYEHSFSCLYHMQNQLRQFASANTTLHCTLLSCIKALVLTEWTVCKFCLIAQEIRTAHTARTSALESMTRESRVYIKNKCPNLVTPRLYTSD